MLILKSGDLCSATVTRTLEDGTPLQILQNVWLHLHPPRVPRHGINFRFTWCMGGITFLMFLVTAVTGVLLMFYYRPTAEYAFRDVQYLEFDIPFGCCYEHAPLGSAPGMVIAVMLHMFRVFLTGSYKKPREFNWGVGVILLVVTLFLSFTGYLLPWDQLAFWAVTVGTNMARATPVLGHEGPFHPQDIHARERCAVCSPRWHYCGTFNTTAVLYSALRRRAVACECVDGITFLAGS